MSAPLICAASCGELFVTGAMLRAGGLCCCARDCDPPHQASAIIIVKTTRNSREDKSHESRMLNSCPKKLCRDQSKSAARVAATDKRGLLRSKIASRGVFGAAAQPH